MSDPVEIHQSVEPTATDLAWAWEFVRELADEQHDDLSTLENLSQQQHIALAHMVGDALIADEAPIRQAAAWVLSAVDFLPLDGIDNLHRAFLDAEPLVRMAAAWATAELGPDGEQFIPELIAALDDWNQGVQFAAACALGDLSDYALAAVPALIRSAKSVDERLRTAALESLGRIAPDDALVMPLLLDGMADPDPTNRLFSMVGLASVKQLPTRAIGLLGEQLGQTDLVLSAGSILGNVGQLAVPIVPALLEALAKYDVQEVARDGEGPIILLVHDELTEALEKILPVAEDTELHDFRLLFLRSVFHPNPLKRADWITAVSRHAWYRRLQRARLRRYERRAEVKLNPSQLRELYESAQSRFAERLWKNPTLGLTAGRYLELPGYVKNHVHKITAPIWKAWQRDHGLVVPLKDSDLRPSPPVNTDDLEAAALIHRFVEELPAEELDIISRRLFDGESWTSIALAMGLSVSMAQTRYERAIKKIRRRFPEFRALR